MVSFASTDPQPVQFPTRAFFGRAPGARLHGFYLFPVLARERTPSLPDLTSAQEQGLAELDLSTWFAVALPKATPVTIVRKLNEAIVAAMNSPAVKEQTKKIGADLVPAQRRSPEYLEKFFASEIANWGRTIKASGVMVD